MKKEKEYIWYKIKIESQIRDIVKDLRNNGVNTTCSCGHEMWIEASVTDETEDIRNILNVLMERNLRFDITLKVCCPFSKDLNRFIHIQILDPKKDIKRFNTLDPKDMYE